MKIFLFLCLLLPLKLYADVTSSCQSTLSDTYTRAVLSDICYTQHGDQFLQWQGYWVDNTDKVFTPVTSWQLSLSAMVAELDWRLPTIKELQLLTTKGLVDVANLAPDAFSENWMVQQWLIRGGTIPSSDAYLLSSSYQGDSVGATTKVFALNLATGLTEALSATDFDAKSVYMVKVKQSQPDWINITTQYSDLAEDCLQHTNALSSDITVADCNGSVQQLWLVESNSGFVRSYSGGCLQAKTFSDREEVTYETCSDSSASVSPANSDRWSVAVEGTGKVFNNRSNVGYYFYVTNGLGSSASKGDVLVWDYSSDSHDEQNIWYY
ncbi:MAG: hypothetical protein ACI9OH_002858 [Oleispira sp.]|jgi:hypothetical protein